MVKFIALLLVLMMLITTPSSAQASFCRTLNDHFICILDIKRSAKNYWEYRASISIDGVEQPVEVYNCRDRTKMRKDGAVVAFDRAGAGTLVCKLFNKR